MVQIDQRYMMVPDHAQLCSSEGGSEILRDFVAARLLLFFRFANGEDRC